jgi:hypothetical protein
MLAPDNNRKCVKKGSPVDCLLAFTY